MIISYGLLFSSFEQKIIDIIDFLYQISIRLN